MNARATSNPSTVPAAWPATDRWPAEERAARVQPAAALPIGTRLNEFEVLGVLGAGGFGIVYLASDRSLQRTVAVKEYFPADFGRRAQDGGVVPRDEADAAMFALGLKSFVREAQLLAGFDHPSLVKVHRFWEAHGTAYMVMPHYPGRTLKEVRPTLDGAPDERWLRRLINPLLSALDVLHRSHVYHRDVSPDNILLLPDGHPILLDFGSARQVAADRTQAITAILKPNFAAIEQYGDVPGLRQGAWTDLYALAGVVHFMITGAPPTPAALRAVKDELPLLALSPTATLSQPFLRAVDWALEVDPRHRPASIEAFRDALHGYTAPPTSPRARSLDAPTAADGGAQHASTTALSPQPYAGSVPVRRTWRRRHAILASLGLGLGLALWASTRPVDLRPAADVAKAAPRQGLPDRVAAVPPVTRPTGSVAPRSPMTDAEITGLSGRQEHAAAVTRARAPVERKPSPAQADEAKHPVAERKDGAPADPAGPRANCGDRSYLSMAVCMDRQCQQAAWRAHPQCAEFRRYAESRRRVQEQ